MVLLMYKSYLALLSLYSLMQRSDETHLMFSKMHACCNTSEAEGNVYVKHVFGLLQ